MTQTPADLYLELLKKALSFSLWPEPPAPLEALSAQARPWQRVVAGLISRLVGSERVQILHQRAATADEPNEGTTWPGYAHTMIGLKRLDNVQNCVETVLRENVPGDLIETGVWRGGACILMRAVLAAYGVEDRRVFVADSFAGLPKPDPGRYPADAGDQTYRNRYLAVTQEDVAENFRKYGLLDEQVVFLQGWFEETLPTAPIEKLAVLRLDGDMYGSTMVALRSLYPKLQPGGFCIIDDYALATCSQAVNDFRREQGISTPMIPIDWTGRFWRKT